MIVEKYIEIASICFYLRLYEGYEMINKVNSIPLTTSELEKATKDQIDNLKMIIVVGSTTDSLPHLQILVQMYSHLRLNLP